MCHIQGNIIFHFTYAIFDKENFLKHTDSLLKDIRKVHTLLSKNIKYRSE